MSTGRMIRMPNPSGTRLPPNNPICSGSFRTKAAMWSMKGRSMYSSHRRGTGHQWCNLRRMCPSPRMMSRSTSTPICWRTTRSPCRLRSTPAAWPGNRLRSIHIRHCRCSWRNSHTDRTNRSARCRTNTRPTRSRTPDCTMLRRISLRTPFRCSFRCTTYMRHPLSMKCNLHTRDIPSGSCPCTWACRRSAIRSRFW